MKHSSIRYWSNKQPQLIQRRKLMKEPMEELVKDLVINGMKVDRDIIHFSTPNEEAAFWTFDTKNGGTIYASGNISFESRLAK
jgi:hypothetical protein